MSSDRPWDADRTLTNQAARAAITSQFADVDATRLEHLGSGWEFDAFLTADGWVFRFPRRAEYAAVFDWEAAVHRLVAQYLAPISVPRVDLAGRPGPFFPYAFAGHRLVAGVRADDPRVRLAPTLATELGAALSAIHSVPEGDARAVGVQRDRDGTTEWLREARDSSPRLSGMESSVDQALDWLDGVVSAPGAYTGPARLIHNDLCPDHLLVDPDAGSLVGILDWTDAALGDPALDFAVLIAWRGAEFAAQVRRAYDLPLDDGFGERLAFIARVMSLVWLHEATEQGTDVAKHIRWVKNAFSGAASF